MLCLLNPDLLEVNEPRGIDVKHEAPSVLTDWILAHSRLQWREEGGERREERGGRREEGRREGGPSKHNHNQTRTFSN